MSTATTTNVELDRRLVDGALARMAQDLSMITDREIEITTSSVERCDKRVEGRGKVHISFKLGLQVGERIVHGALLVPLPEAISLAGYLMMTPDEGVKARRGASTLDGPTKDAMMEVGNFIGGAFDAAVRDLGVGQVKVRSEGCQGVRANVRPAFRHEDGEALVVARAQWRIHTWPPFEAVLMLPPVA
jgi:hypothetical protein